jgi:hypothetical protein
MTVERSRAAAPRKRRIRALRNDGAVAPAIRRHRLDRREIRKENNEKENPVRHGVRVSASSRG